jgi:hypothetical protein
MRQIKTALASTKTDLSFLPECKNLLLIVQKQLIEISFYFQNTKRLADKVLVGRFFFTDLNKKKSIIFRNKQ